MAGARLSKLARIPKDPMLLSVPKRPSRRPVMEIGVLSASIPSKYETTMPLFCTVSP